MGVELGHSAKAICSLVASCMMLQWVSEAANLVKIDLTDELAAASGELAPARESGFDPSPKL